MNNKKKDISADVFPLSGLRTDASVKEETRKLGIGLQPSELRRIAGFLGRDPSLTECYVFDVEWSEHCSYKSSRKILKKYLPTSSPDVIMGVGQDAGIIRFEEAGGREYGVVISHESHNHPSQVLPNEGAGTGIGGIVRDVDCMGARVVAVADSLRFADRSAGPAGRWIECGVIDGIWEYANALGVPNLCGEVYYDESFNGNCLVNVTALGIVESAAVIPSRAPAGSDKIPHDIIIVGKPTDDSGFGGVRFASEPLEGGGPENKGAVQVPDPFLKNVLLMRKANEAVWKLARAGNVPVGMKDIGGGGLACATSELVSDAGFGAEIDLDRVHSSIEGLPSHVIACAETQERYILIVPSRLSPEILDIYNRQWALPEIYEGAKASVIGRVMPGGRYVLKSGGRVVCDVPVDKLTAGISYDREMEPARVSFREYEFAMPADMRGVLLEILASDNIRSREYVFRNYDTEVQGNAVLRPGEADAGVIAPLEEEGSPAGIALSVDGNPFYGIIDPYMGGVNAVFESMRNVAAVGAVPTCITDCLNYGNPENPEVFWQFSEGVRGVSDAASNLWLKGREGAPVPVVSGNVSFYNESADGRAVAPSPVVACVGIMPDYSAAVSMRFKKPGNFICLVGDRYEEMGGSQYYRVCRRGAGGKVPACRFPEARGQIYGVTDCVAAGLLYSCHDISDGGLAVAVAEMLLCSKEAGSLGAEIDLDLVGSEMRDDKKLFSESGGFVMEVGAGNIEKVENIFRGRGIQVCRAGMVTESPNLVFRRSGEALCDVSVKDMKKAWRTDSPEPEC